MFGLKLFKKKQAHTPTEVFWNWFIKNKDRFKRVFDDTEKAHDFIDKLVEQLNEVHPSLKALAGPYDDKQFELIITADGEIAQFVKVEELVASAPQFNDWIITAHKPRIGLDKISTEMYGYVFSSNTMQFYPNIEPDYPDEVNIILVHKDYNKEQHKDFQTGALIFLDNALGEINLATMIDSCEVKPAEKNVELIPLIKLEDYIKWREKEFLEKYEKIDIVIPDEQPWNILEAENKNGLPIIATISSKFKNWEYKAAFPWLVQIDISFSGNERGFPDDSQMQSMQEIEDNLLDVLKPTDLIYLGHETHNNFRSIFSYTDDYKLASKIIHSFLEKTKSKFEISFFIQKDKYWRTMEWYFNANEKEEDDEEDDN
jgi:hypothetical protein